MCRVVFVFLAMMLASSVALADAKEVESTYQRGYDAWNSGDIVGAMPPLKEAADAGHAKAQALYASLLDHADNDAEALVYYRKAAEQGDPDGAFGLAGFYVTGDTGEKDPKKALPLYQMAAERGHLASIKALANGYLSNVFGDGPDMRHAPETWKLVRYAAEKEELDFMTLLEHAYREGNPQVPKDVAAADALKLKIDKALGLDAKKKRRRR